MRTLGHWENEGQACGLLAGAEWLTAAEDWPQYVEALLFAQVLASSFEGWKSGWKPSAVSHFQVELQFLSQQACLALCGDQWRPPQTHCLGVLVLRLDETFFVQHLRAGKDFRKYFKKNSDYFCTLNPKLSFDYQI